MSNTRIVFVHGMDGYGAAAWPAQHLLAGHYDCLFLKRTGFDAVEPPVSADFDVDAQSIIDALGGGGHVVAHAQGAVPAMMAAVMSPGLVHSLVLVEPLLLSLTAELPATAALLARMAQLRKRASTLSDAPFLAEFNTLMAVTTTTNHESFQRRAKRARLQLASTGAALQIIPGVPTTVLTGGWEPVYEEVAQALATTGARHVVHRSSHRPHDTAAGAALIAGFIAAAAVHVGPQD